MSGAIAHGRVYSAEEWAQIEAARIAVDWSGWILDQDWVLSEVNGTRQYGEAPRAQRRYDNARTTYETLKQTLGVSFKEWWTSTHPKTVLS